MFEDRQTVHPRPGLISSLSPEKRWLLFVYFPVMLLVYLVVGILLDHYVPGMGKLFDVVFAIASNVMAYAWCRIDSTERGYELHRFFSYAIVIFGVLALLYYLFRSRGFDRGLRAVGWLIVYVICCYIPVLLISLAIFIILVVTGLAPPDVFS